MSLDNVQSSYAIFLDVDGVIHNSPDELGEDKKVRELFPHKPNINDRYEAWEYNIATSHFFDQKALKNLDKIIEGIEKKRKVIVVISSSWRVNNTVEELRDKIFALHNFSKHIKGKTPMDSELNRVDLKGYCIKCKDSGCRAVQINYWLDQHPEVIDYGILDDIDEHLSINFGKRFFQTDFKTLLTEKIADEILNTTSGAT